jgi:signal transduction histidine kinase/ligand-binding sensor domain-containing protein
MSGPFNYRTGSVIGIVLSVAALFGSLFLLLPAAPASFAQTASPSPSSSPSPSPTPSPSPSPTPVTGLHQWGAVTLFHGLPSDRVHAVAQTGDGSMWFGTEAGLAKFDGRRTQAVNDPALPAGRVLALQTDQNGELWIGTEAGAARFSDGKFEAIKDVAGQTVSSIIAPDTGRVIMATEQGQVFECRSATTSTVSSVRGNTTEAEVSISAHPLLDHPLDSADRDHPGPLIITSLAWTNNRLLAGSLSRGVVTVENGAAKDVQMRPMAFFVRALEIDSKGKLWVGARSKKEEPGALTGSDPANLVRNEAVTGPVMTIKAIGPEIWLGTDGRGVFRFLGGKTQRLTFDGTAGGLRSDHVYAIFPDREGVIWFGTDRGVCRYDPRAPRVESVGDNPESNFVRALYQTAGGKILAGTNRGLFVYDTENFVWNPVAELSRNIIYAIAEDKSGRLLVGSASGFYVAQKQSDKLEEQTFTRVEASSGNADGTGSIRAITIFRGTTYLASFGRGVERFDERRTISIGSNSGGTAREVVSLLSDNDARLLIGTAKDGLLSFDGQDIKADPVVGIKGVVIRSMARISDGALFFGTSRGVYVCTPNAACTIAVPNVDARFLLSRQDDQVNEVWCGTTGNGLLKILLDPKLGPVVAQLDSEQGLPAQNVFAVLPRGMTGSEDLLIATSRGVARYEPGRLAPTLFVTRIISKRVHTVSELAGGLNLEYPQNSLLLDVSAMSTRTFPEQFQYAFTLIDTAGHSIKQKLSRDSQFTMEGLSPGKYSVTARAFTKDLVSSAPLTFDFSVARAPFPWTSTALAILLALALMALLWAILERRRIVATSAALVGANRELADARLNLANEAERERGRIARDLHDQTLADLRHLALLTDQLKTNGNRAVSVSGSDTGATQSQSAGLRQEIESISHEVRRICEDLSPSVLQNVGFAAALEFALSHAVQDAPPEKRFAYEFQCEDSLEERSALPPSVQMQIYRIVQEAISNICRHAQATQVNMHVTSSPEAAFLLRLEDNGKSFNVPNNNSEGRGLANMRARAALIDAKLSWEKREGGGTIFTLKKGVSHEEA